MEEGRRSGQPSGYVVKSKGPSGCLIVRKKGSDVVGAGGSSNSRKLFESKKEKKRPRLDFSDSGSGDGIVMYSRRRLVPETPRICNGASDFDAAVEEESEITRKRSRGEGGRRSEMNGIVSDKDNLIDRTRTRLDVLDFDEYEGSKAGSMRRKRAEEGGIDSRRFYGSMTAGRSSIEREYDSGSSRDANRKGPCFERASGMTRGDRSARDRVQLPAPVMSDDFESDQPIRVQGKNGVLKVMVNKKKKVGGSLNGYNAMEPEEVRKGVRTEEVTKNNILMRPSCYSESKQMEKAIPNVGREKKPMNLQTSLKSEDDNVSDQDSDDSGILLTKKTNMRAKYAEPSDSQKMLVSASKSVSPGMNSDDSDTSLKGGSNNAGGLRSRTRTSNGDEKTTPNQLPPSKINDVKAKRGSGTEKQKLRERIRGMLVDAGWTIDYRPRRNRDYLDAVYINPAGTAYWSIIKAYDALLKQLNEDEEVVKAKIEYSQITPLPDELLSQLTRNTSKRMQKEMRKKQRGSRQSENAREAIGRKASSRRYDEESMESHSQEEKLSSFIKQTGKSFKGKLYCNSSTSVTSKGNCSTHTLHGNDEKVSSGYNNHRGRKSRKLGRCTLLVRKSNQGLYRDDSFVPYTGKRTLLCWLVDSGAVQLSQKVRYMNRRRTKILLEGWVTRDGIHCGCCSKILTVSKFEIHAGSKLRQPFQNIYLDSGVSLLDCQIDAWNRQEAAENIGFHSVDVDGDDPNDDTCALCGDGGDLICCDGCPSTFHQSCLDIEMLPPGDWHCPNCTCKFCGSAGDNIVDEDDPTVSVLPTCSLCARKYHESCLKDMDATVEGDSSQSCFCSKKCRELFEQLLKYLGVKHELEAGFSWCLTRRTDFDLDTSLQGLPQRVEGNSKLAVALSVMDECFLPIIDRRSGINLIHGVLYNCGSNFNRLNYSGFFTVILERGDEIISAASIRLHGTELAEMPFIGTRHIYRRQGMCRRLFCAVESVLRSLKVEKLIIPAISELMHTWTEVFGFTNVDESLKRELKSMNTMVFPGVDMLQKQLLEQDTLKKSSTNKGVKEKGPQGDKSLNNGSARDDLHQSDNGGLEHNNSEAKVGGLAKAKSDSSCPDASANSTKSSLDASHEIKQSVSSDSGLVDKEKLNKSRISHVKSASGEDDDIASHTQSDNQFLLPISSANVSGMSGSPDGSHGHEQPENDEAAKFIDESASVANHLTMSIVMSSEREVKEAAALNSEENGTSCKNVETDDAQAFNLMGESTSEEEYKGLFSTEQTKSSGGFRKDSEPTNVDAPEKQLEEYQVGSGLEATNHEHGYDTDASSEGQNGI